MTTAPAAPIALLAFNRPLYFREVLESLMQQVDVDLSERQIGLFLDGVVSPHSGKHKADPALVRENISIFKEFFPGGMVFDSPVNLGVALNFDRAERWMFDELGADGAIFMEDDMVLSPNYLSVLDRMLRTAISDRRIGYVGAFGDWKLPVEEQRKSPGRLITLVQHWAFGLTRRQWVRTRPFMQEYLSLVGARDYSERDEGVVYDFYERHGMWRSGSSQDRAKANATCMSQGLRVNTTACLARYIGMQGQHFNERVWEKMGLAKTQIYDQGRFDVESLTDERYHELLAEQRQALGISAPALAPGQSLSFARGADGWTALTKGFHSPEEWGAWSSGKTAVIELRTPTNAAGHASGVWVDARYNLPREITDVDVRVSVNGEDAGSINLSRRQSVVDIRVGPDALSGDNIRLSFSSPFVGSPKDFGIGEDQRPLTLGVASIGLR